MQKPKVLTATETKAYRLAKMHAVREAWLDMENLLIQKDGDTEDPIYRIYRNADKLGFEKGVPVFQGGLPPEGFKGRTLKITGENGMLVFVTMGALLETLGKAVVKALGETYDERRNTTRD